MADLARGLLKVLGLEPTAEMGKTPAVPEIVPWRANSCDTGKRVAIMPALQANPTVDPTQSDLGGPRELDRMGVIPSDDPAVSPRFKVILPEC